MASSEERVVAVIMVGGPTKGTRFRPLSLNIPKPLFPLAGQPMVHHPISACKRIPNLAQIYLVGFYEEREFALYVSSISNELKVPVRYLREDKPHGSAGGLYNFRDLILEDNPVFIFCYYTSAKASPLTFVIVERISHIFLLNCDVCCSFPLPEMLEAHRRYGGMGTILVIKVSAESAYQFGELVADPVTNELLHYTEKPETFVSDRINCGVYIFRPDIFTAIGGVSTQRKDRANLRRMSSFDALQSATRSLPSDFVRLDQDILSPLAGKKQLYTYETMDFWEQIKTPGMALKCSALYLAQYRCTSSHLLASGDGTNSASIIGDVYIHPSAKVHSTAKNIVTSSSIDKANLLDGLGDEFVFQQSKFSDSKMGQSIGPNVSISANARVGPGVRLISCIILDDVEIKENAVVIHAIVGWKSSIGRWSRVQVSQECYTYPNMPILLITEILRILHKSFCNAIQWHIRLLHLSSEQAGGDHNAKLGITILGEAVNVEDEVVVVNSIVLPNKTLNMSVQEEIIL
ncbi:hypothetical protein RHGRI_034881 [Rhododendron griersonianum]|uniref:Nucleotidyl transferase domain-containing protein n=1 Tax=Rhododendron griersonianum TaxID=479676 RepID=A0AAV6I2D7_9ERIC|nr:hypothetical protein RHGRI_034881 [Rhododendron griersonianum]